ncbi:hypothetical protein DAMA08_050520 [Martiniozyma asiatica (nom. inval.)]|nr:hypothetical protein DAMA08_050520 [Martiniozyma asiatica]
MNSGLKTVALVFSGLVSLASGTPYLYGVYSPQLINRCGFNAIDSSYLSFAANIGSSIGGFFAGLFIDKFGITFAILLGAILESLGFLILYLNFKNAWHQFPLLCLAMISIGWGSVLAYFSTLKAATLNFPKHRGMANAVPVSAYGLAALFYAFISTELFKGDIEGLLKFIAVFSGVIIGLGAIFINIYEDEKDPDLDERELDAEVVSISSTTSESSEDGELKKGLKYLLKGHRGSFANINMSRSDSVSSIWSDITEVQSLSSYSTVSRDNSTSSLQKIDSPLSISANKPMPIQTSNQKSLHRSSFLGSSPLDFKARTSFARTGSSYRNTNSISNSPRSKFQSNMKRIPVKANALVDDTAMQTANPDSLSNSPAQVYPVGSSGATSFLQLARIGSSYPNNQSSNSSMVGAQSYAKPSSLTENLKQSATSESNQRSFSNAKVNNYGSIKPDIPASNSAHITTSVFTSEPALLTESVTEANSSVNSFSSTSMPLVKTTNDDFKTITNLNGANDELFDPKQLLARLNNKREERRRRSRKPLTAKEHVMKLLKNKLFLLHYLMNALCVAIGQVYIYGVGFIVRAQVNYLREHQIIAADIPNWGSFMISAFGMPFTVSSISVDSSLAQKSQALQVSIISLANFLGRLISGPASDIIHKQHKKNRAWVLIISTALLLTGQLSLLFLNKLHYLSISSFLIGLAFGSIYGTMPSIVADTFGAKNFATTWSLVGTGPISVFLILSDYFGSVYDRNSQWGDLDGIKIKMCVKGNQCYSEVIQWLAGGCFFIAFGYLSIILWGEKLAQKRRK